MKKATYLVLTMVVVAFAASYASAQRSVNVRFTRGQSEATFTNTVSGYGYVDFVFNARAGQHLTATLVSSTGNKAIMTVMKNGLRVADDSAQVPEWSGDLNDGGRHVVRIAMMRNDARRTKRPVRFTLRIRIT